MYALPVLFAFTVLFGSRTTFACSGISEQVGEMTRDTDVFLGTAFTLNCTLTTNQLDVNGTTYTLNSSMIYFKFKEKKLSAPVVIDNRTALYTVRESIYNDSGRYFCYVNVPVIEESRYVCVTKISVGIAPKLIAEDKFRCIGQAFRNFTCSWDPPYVGEVHTEYFISMYPTRSFPFAKTDCAVKLNNTACQWRIDTDPPYRLSPTKFLFTVVSYNTFGEISQRFFVDHFEVVIPSPPQEFSLLSLTSTSISLSWDPPMYAEHDESVRQHIRYQLQYRPIFEEEPLARYQLSSHVKDVSVDVGNALQATITKLYPNVIYSVKIRCRIANDSSEEKWSKFTAEIRTITYDDAPFNAPRFTSGAFESTETDAADKRNVKLYWTPLSFEYFNAAGFKYEIVYYSTNSLKKSVITEKIEPSESSHTFENMDMKTAYTFRIFSINNRGISSEFHVMNVDSHERLLEKPKDVSVFYYGNTTYEIRWNSSNHGNTDGFWYTVFWCADLHGSGCRDPLKSMVVPSYREATTINVSNKDSSYRFAVAANTNKSSSGLAWTKCVVSIVGDTLPKISEFTVEPGGNSSLTVTWGFPCTIVESVFERFEIFYCKANPETTACEVNTSMRLVVEGGRTKVAEIENLEAHTAYRVMMRGLSDRGQSEYTHFLVTKTAPGPPPPPTNFRYLSVTARGFILTWDINANDTIDSFDVKIRDITNPIGDLDMEYTERLFRSQCINVTTCILPLSNRKYIESYHLYDVKLIACVNSVMNGVKLKLCSPSLTSITVRTAVSAPSVMEKPHAEPFNKTSVRVSWKKPEPPNGPIDSYNLYIFWSDNKTDIVEVSGNTTSMIVSPDCFDDAMTSFKVQAINMVNGEPQYGDLSEETVVNGCIIFESQNRGLVVGIAVGCALLLVMVLFILTSLGKFIKKKIDDLKKWSIVLPDGLKTIPDESFGVKMKPFSRNEDIEKAECADYDSFKNRHNSGTSEMTECSTDGLLTSVNQKGHKFQRTYSDQSNPETGHESVSSTSTCATHVSSDSGASDGRHDFISFSSSDSKSQTHERKLMKSSLPSVEENQISDSSGSRDSGLDVSSNNSAGRVLRKNKRNKTKQQAKKTFGRPSDMISGNASLSYSEPSLYDYSKTYIPNEIIDTHTMDVNHAKSVTNIFDHLPAEALSVHLANVSANEDGDGGNGEGSPLSVFAHNCYNKSFPIRDNYVTPEVMRMISTHQMNEKQEKSNEVTKPDEDGEALKRCDSKQSLDKDILGMEREMVETSKDFSPLDLNLTDNVNVFKHENGICFENKKDLPENHVTNDIINYSNGVESHIDASKEDIDPHVSFVNCTPNSPHSSSSSLSSSSSSLSSSSPLTRSVPNTAPPNSGYITQQQMFNFSHKPNVEVNSDANGTSVISQPQLIRNASGYVSFTNHQTANSMPSDDIDSIV